ncbi:MAG: hypothetical protein JKY84_05605 [Emcibacteraceae bacterium]|nr:hypothetical protein [Emcibacteraceae bacterium]
MNKLIKTGTLFLVLSFLAGCGSGGFHYYKPGITKQQENKDAFECRQEATYYNQTATANAYGGAAYTEPMVNVELAKACLRARGYQITEQ